MNNQGEPQKQIQDGAGLLIANDNSGSAAKYVWETMKYGYSHVFARGIDWSKEEHDRQHGVYDARSEISMMLGSALEGITTGDYKTTLGLVLWLQPDALHSFNLVRCSGGYDYLKNEKITFKIPPYVAERLPETGIDVQSLRFDTSASPRTIEWMLGAELEKYVIKRLAYGLGSIFSRVADPLISPFNQWLAANSVLNLKMFPNKAGRFVEMATGLAFIGVGSVLAVSGAPTEQMREFNDVRGALAIAIGSGTVAAATIDIAVNQSEEKEETADADIRDSFIVRKSTSETSLSSVLKAFPRYILGKAANLHNDAQVKNLSEEDLTRLMQDPEMVKIVEDSVARSKKGSLLPEVVRGIAVSVISEIKDLNDEFDPLRENLKQDKGVFAKLRSVMKDIRQAPPRWGGTVHLTTSQLLPVLGLYTAVGGIQNAPTLMGQIGLAVSGAFICASYGYKNLSLVNKAHMTLLGTRIGEAGPKEPTI